MNLYSHSVRLLQSIKAFYTCCTVSISVKVASLQHYKKQGVLPVAIFVVSICMRANCSTSPVALDWYSCIACRKVSCGCN